ncbi:MAG: hypothetical protein ACI8WB_003919, partial [Phenylobacterium sp.]
MERNMNLFTFKHAITALAILGCSSTFSAHADHQSQPFSNGQWVDLTHEFNEDSIYWPTAEPFKKTTVFE